MPFTFVSSHRRRASKRSDVDHAPYVSWRDQDTDAYGRGHRRLSVVESAIREMCELFDVQEIALTGGRRDSGWFALRRRLSSPPIARGRCWLDEIVSVRSLTSSRSRTPKMQALRRTRSRAGRGQRVVCHAALESSDFVMLRQNGAAVRSPRTESAIITDRVKTAVLASRLPYSRLPKGIGRETLARGTEFLDAETAG